MTVVVQQSDPQWAKTSDEETRAARASLGGESPRCGVSRTRALQNSLRAPAEARTFVAERICPRHGRLAIPAAALVASELVTEAALGGEGPITIAVECGVTTLTVSVTCSMGSLLETVELCLGDPVAAMILERICRATGSVRTEGELTMWATLPTGHIPVRNPRPERTSLGGSGVSSRQQSSVAMRTLNAPNPQYGT